MREKREYDEKTQPGIAPGSYWRVLTPKQQERVLIATVREVLAEIDAEEKAEQLTWTEVVS